MEQGQRVNYEMVRLSMKQALAFNPEDLYELQENDVHEEIKEAEMEGLDNFLLENQDEDPTLLDQLQETIKSYQTLIDEQRYKSDQERDKILNLIKTLQKQVEQVKKDQ